MKRFFLLFLAFTVSLSVFSVLLPAKNANAASVYDNLLKNQTYPFMLQGSGNYIVNTLFDAGGALGLATGEENCFPDAGAKSRILNDIAARPHIMYTDYLNTGQLNIYLYIFNQVPTQTWTPGEIYLNVPGGTFDRYSVRATSNSTTGIVQCAEGVAQTAQNTVTIDGSGSYPGTKIIQIGGFEFNYPPNYDGEIIVPVVTKDDYYPLVGYTVFDDNTLNALNDGVFEDVCVPVGDPTSGCAPPNITWEVLNEDDEVLNTQRLSLREPYTYKFPGNDTYYLQATYSLPPPYLQPSPDVNLVTVRIQIDANGTFQKGGTGVNECSMVSGKYFCEPANPLEDCTTYGLDLGGYFQCIINNFGIWLRNTLIYLFVPRYSFFESWTTSFGDYLNSKLGFVYQSIALIITLFNGLVSNASSGTCTVSPPGEIFGASFTVDVCDFQQVVGNTVFNLLQGLVISLTILALIFAGYRKYIEVVSQR